MVSWADSDIVSRTEVIWFPGLKVISFPRLKVKCHRAEGDMVSRAWRYRVGRGEDDMVFQASGDMVSQA